MITVIAELWPLWFFLGTVSVALLIFNFFAILGDIRWWGYLVYYFKIGYVLAIVAGISWTCFIIAIAYQVASAF